MGNLKLRKLAKFRIQMWLMISAALAPALYAQAPKQLQVDVGPNQQVRIVASEVSYGEVLRALQRKLGWEIEIPPMADELKLSNVRIEALQPQIGLVKLLEGSRLGYAFLRDVNGSGRMKVLVIPLPAREASPMQRSASTPPVTETVMAGTPLPLPAQPQTGATSQPSAAAAEITPDQPPAPQTMSLADAINAIGAPPGVSTEDVGKAMTYSISDAARIMGFPPGVSPTDVGKTVTMPLPTGPGKRP
jgi:hypothetical protein